MRKWAIGGCAVAVAVVAAVVFAPPRAQPSRPAAPDASEPPPVVAAPTPPEPVVLAAVVDVTDIDPLLHPPAIPPADPGEPGPMLTAVGYEVPAPRRADPTMPVVPIPLAADEPGQ